jgi:hypothetical protein
MQKAAAVAATELTVSARARSRRQPLVTGSSWRALGVMLLVFATSCADDPESGLSVESVDATFGLARTGTDGPEAGAPGAPPMSESGMDATALPQDGAAVADAVNVDAGPPPRSCRNLAAFTEKVTPLLVERCVRCHDGTKSKATKVSDLTTARDLSVGGQQRACDEILKGAPDTSERSPIFAEVNPSDSTTVHDFKYPSSMAYMAYRSTVLTWLETE